jgi:methylase of polypeptide subunit release factors
VLPDDFAQRLERIGVTAQLASYPGGQTSLREIVRDRAALDHDLGTAVDFLCLGQSIQLETARQLFGAGIIDLLCRKEMAHIQDGVVGLSELRLVGHFGSLVFVGAPGAHRNGYYGPDSIGLGAHLLRAQGDCLDLFASTGAQSVLMARSAQRVVAVEIDAKLADLFALNTSLNAVQHVTRTIWADALDADLGGPYDTVSVNAPLLPSFGLSGLARGADGGFDGHQLLASALRRLPLRRGAAVHATATLLGDEQGPDIAWLAEIGRETGMSLRIVLTGMAVVARNSPFGRDYAATLAQAAGRSPQDVYQELLDRWARMSVDRFFFCIISGHKSAVDTGAKILARTTKGTGWRL